MSSFEVTITLPDTNPTAGFPGLFFPNQTVYQVSPTGVIGMSGSVDESFTFSIAEIVPPPFPPRPSCSLATCGFQ